MPRSKKRSTYTPPPRPKPKASPVWLPWTGIGLLGIGVLVVILYYLLPGAIPAGRVVLTAGFVAMGAGLVVLSRWR